MSTSKCVNRFLFAKFKMGFDLSLTEYILRRYAAGSTAGSGALGKVTSGIDGPGIDGVLNVEPLVAFPDCMGPKPTLELRLPFEAIESPPIDAFEPFRENRPISGDILLYAGCVLLSVCVSKLRKKRR